jgi:hypothetical protein
MSQQDRNNNNIKSRRKRGRPSVLERDPNLASRVTELRLCGLSWSTIASRLGVGRTTARRLFSLYQKGVKGQTREDSNSAVPENDTHKPSENPSQYTVLAIDYEILGKLPKTFQIFSSLLEKVRDMDIGKG